MTSEAPAAEPIPEPAPSSSPEGAPATVFPSASMAGSVAASAALFLAGLQVPFVVFLAPIPLLRLGIRRGPALQAIGCAFALATVAAVLLGLDPNADSAALAMALFVAVGIVPARLGLRGLLDGWGIGRTLAATLAVEMTWIGMVLYSVSRSTGLTLADEVREVFDDSRRRLLETLESSGLSVENLDTLDRSLRSSAEFWGERYPFLAVLGFGIGLAVVFALVPRLSGRPDDPLVAPFRFEEFRNPFVLVFGFVLGGVGTALGHGIGRFLATNLLLAVLLLCFLQGFSVVYAFLTRIPVGRWFRVLVYILMIQFPMTLAVAGIGLFDGFFEFRRHRP